MQMSLISAHKMSGTKCVQALLDAGADLTGKTHLDELAYSLNGENIHYGTPVNPACPDRIPGGSSSGSAVSLLLCVVMSCHVMSCHVLSCDVMSCHAALPDQDTGCLLFCSSSTYQPSICSETFQHLPKIPQRYSWHK